MSESISLPETNARSNVEFQRAKRESRGENGLTTPGVDSHEGQSLSQFKDSHISDEEFEAFRDLIYAEAGISLNEGKRFLVRSRLSKRLRHFGFETFTEYYQYLMEEDADGQERQLMINSLTTNKTDFFREAHHFAFLKARFVPLICARTRPGEPIKLRIWSAGCSTGEEPYTIAISLRECLGIAPVSDVRLLASDIDTECLNHARTGAYLENRLEPVPENLKSKYFTHSNATEHGEWVVRPDIQQMITFRRINLMDESWPIHVRFDAIFCRNVIIYFDRTSQLRLLDRFASVLHPEGYLFLGHSESLQGLTDRFLSEGGGIYRLNPMWAPCVRPLQQTGSPNTDTPFPVDSDPRSQWDFHSGAEPSALAVKPLRIEEDLILGDVRASRAPAIFKTVLGSCVAACLFDPVARIGGMNHFALPTGNSDYADSCRFGVHAMELLVNELMRLGCDRRRFQAKVFGGCTSAKLSVATGPRNAQFILKYLEAERIPLVAYHLGGTTGWRLHFYTDTGRALVKPLESNLFDNVLEHERSDTVLSEEITQRNGGSVILF